MIYKHIRPDDKVSDVMAHSAFEGHGRLLFPWDDKDYYKSTMTMRDVPAMHLWHTNMDVTEMVQGVNRMIDDRNAGKQVFYDIYTDTEKIEDRSRENTGLFFLRGKPGAPFAVVCPGGGFCYVGSLHEGFPVAEEINRLGHNAFVLKYRTNCSAKKMSADLVAAVNFIRKNHEKLDVSADNYSLWGGSAGARLCSYVTYGGTGLFRQGELLHPAVDVIAYTYFDFVPRFTSNDPPGFFITGTRDWLVPVEATRKNVNGLKRAGVNVEFWTPKNAEHGFGVGKGTPAEGWIQKAVRFWKSNMK